MKATILFLYDPEEGKNISVLGLPLFPLASMPTEPAL